MSNFDVYSETYREQLERAYGGVGDPELFTELKAKVLLEVASKLLGPPATLSVLDVGCGPGLTDSYLVGRFGRVTGCDVAATMVARAQRANPDAQYVAFDGRRTPFDDGAFDLTFAISVLHHIDPRDRAGFVAEMARATRRGGVVAILEHNPVNPLTRLVVARCEFDEGVELVTQEESKRLVAEAGAPLALSRYIVFFPVRAALARRIERRLGRVPLGAQYVVAGRRW